MLGLPLSASELEAFEIALRATVRVPRITAQLYSRTGAPLPITFEVLDGEVQIDATKPRESPSRTAYLTVVDKARYFSVDWNDASNRALWFNKHIRITYGVYVASLGRFIDVPVFHGPIFTAARRGGVIDIDCQGKEALHLDTARFTRSFWIRKHTKKHQVIRAILEARGETEFDLEPTNKRLHRDRVFTMGGIPWKACVNIADGIDRQLYCDGRGRFRLRHWPENPAWKFSDASDQATIVGDPEESVTREGVINLVIVRGERVFKTEVNAKTKLAAKVTAGDSSFTVTSNATKFVAGAKVIVGGAGGNPDERRVDSRVGSQVFIHGTFARNHAKGAEVSVRIKEDAIKRIVGTAKLDRNHLLSADFLGTDFVRIVERPNIHQVAAATEKAEAILSRVRSSLGDDIEFSFPPVPHLEEGDRIRVEALNKTVRIRTMTIPLTLDGLATINHRGAMRVPKRGKKHGG